MLSYDARKYLHKNNITYVFFGEEEKGYGGLQDLSVYKELRVVHQEGNVTIYTVVF